MYCGDLVCEIREKQKKNLIRTGRYRAAILLELASGKRWNLQRKKQFCLLAHSLIPPQRKKQTNKKFRP